MKAVMVLEAWGDGGTEAYVGALGQELSSRGECVEVVLLSGEQPVLEWASDIIVLGVSGIKALPKLRRELKTRGWCVVHLHLYTHMLIGALGAFLSKNCRSVATWHSPLYAWNKMHLVFQSIAARLSDGIVGGSEGTAGELRKWRKDAVTISPPIPRCEEISERETVFTVVGCGRLSEEKDWGTLVSAISILVKGGESDIFCKIIGEGESRKGIEEKIEELRVGANVSLMGRLAHAQAMAEVGSAHVFVLPSRFEGFGMAAVEAMAKGVPTITSDFPASLEYIEEGKTGNRFPIGDAEELAKSILWHKQHSDESQEIGRQGKACVDARYSVERIADLHLEVYEEVLGGKRL